MRGSPEQRRNPAARAQAMTLAISPRAVRFFGFLYTPLGMTNTSATGRGTVKKTDKMDYDKFREMLVKSSC